MGGKQEQAEMLVFQPHLTAFCVSEKNCIFRLNTSKPEIMTPVSG
jgi:hypothetical protein